MDNRVITLTGGNIRNQHFYLRELRDFFPPDVFGGSSESEPGRSVTVHWGGPEPAVTDIAADKMIFRSRDFVRAFFSRYQLVEGERIAIEKLSDYEYRIAPLR
jgi:hypothetical protein